MTDIAAVRAVFVQFYAADVCARPHGEFAVAVFAYNERVHASRIDVESAPDQEFEPCGVEHRAAPEHLLRGQSRKFIRHVRQHVHGIADDEYKRVGVVFDYLRHYRLEHLDVVVDTVHARFALFFARRPR